MTTPVPTTPAAAPADGPAPEGSRRRERVLWLAALAALVLVTLGALAGRTPAPVAGTVPAPTVTVEPAPTVAPTVTLPAPAPVVQVAPTVPTPTTRAPATRAPVVAPSPALDDSVIYGLYSAGTYRVGADIAPGDYWTSGPTTPDDYASWRRLSNLTGTYDAVLALDTVEGHTVITVLPTDAAVQFTGSAVWTAAQG